MTESNKRFINGIPYYPDKDTEEEEKGYWFELDDDNKTGLLVEGDSDGNITYYDGHGNITHIDKCNETS
jgi:hypothetical protein